jgi:GMP synthase (glutamine-hydrolysing)
MPSQGRHRRPLPDRAQGRTPADSVDTIAVLDFGSQYAQLIARRLREAHVYAELQPWNTPEKNVLGPNIKGFVLSGGPASIYQPEAPKIPDYVLASGLPILGICYGMQALTHALGGRVDASAKREYGPARIEILMPSVLSELSMVWMSHGDRITRMPSGFVALAKSDHSPLAAIGDLQRKYFGVQFHPEVRHTPNGTRVLRHFAVEICGAASEWTPKSIVAQAVQRIRRQVGEERVLSAVRIRPLQPRWCTRPSGTSLRRCLSTRGCFGKGRQTRSSVCCVSACRRS